MSAAEFTHGVCECRDGCQCAGVGGPAAFEVVRVNRTLRVCTRCLLSGDTERRLLVTAADKREPWASYDALGFFVITQRLLLAERESKELPS